MDASLSNQNWDTDILKQIEHLMGSRRKRRIDGDFKNECFEKLAEHRAANLRELNHTNNLGCLSAKHWTNNIIMQEVAAQRLTWGRTPSIDLFCQDASRFGNPAEETMM